MERDIVKRIEDLMDLFDERNPLAGGGRIGFSDGPDLRKRPGGPFANKTKEEIAEIIAKKNPTRTITKEENIKKIFDKIFEEKDFSGIKSEFPGVGKEEQKAGIKKNDPSRKGKTGGKIPNQYYTKIVGPAVRGDADALKDLARITGRTVDELKDAFSKRNLKTVRSEAAAKSSAKLDPVNRKLADLVRSGVVDKETIKKTLNISEDKFQKSIATLFKISYGNRRQINKGNKITSYVGNTAEEITNLLQKLKQVDGVDQVVQRRNITQILDDLFGKEGTMPNPNSYNIMMKRVDEFYKLRALLPEGIKLNLDHPIPEILIQQLEKSAPTALRANVQPITQALNLGLKSKIDTAYANAYDLASRGDVNAKKIMGAIDEVAEKIGLPLGKVTDKYVDLGKNPFLRGDLKRIIVDNLKAQNLIVSKFEALDPKLKQRAGLDRLKNINIPQINIKAVEQAFGISNEGGFIDRQLLTDAVKGLGKATSRVVGAGFGPTGLGLLTATDGGYDLSSPLDRFILGAEATFAPDLVKGTIGATKGMKNRALQKIAQRALNLGVSIPTALKVSRVASPIGIMSILGERSIAAGKNISEEANRIDAIQDKNLQQLEYENLIKNIKGFARGGLSGGDKSGPPPVRGPNPQGLLSLKNRVRNL